MKRWEFKNTTVGSDGKVIFTELSEEQKKRIPDYIEVLRTAYGSDVPRPPYSNYFCKEAIGVVGGPKVPAGNIEYGVCQALHGEEAAVAAFRGFYRRKPENEKVVLGILADQPGEIPALCGNCRDILFDEFGPDLEVVAGSPEFKSVIIVSMRDYLFPDFEELPFFHISRELYDCYEKLIKYKKDHKIENDVYSGSLHPERKYYAMISTSEGEFFGAIDIMCDYHPIYPLRDAIRQIRRELKNKSFIIHNVCILFEGLEGVVKRHVMYKDRQHLLELNAEIEARLGQQQNPPVFLFDDRHNASLVALFKTTVREWLPFAFVPSAFGNNFQK
jgi:cytidine deaminase